MRYRIEPLSVLERRALEQHLMNRIAEAEALGRNPALLRALLAKVTRAVPAELESVGAT